MIRLCPAQDQIHTPPKREVFSSDALSLLHEASRGHLRDIDRIATDCLNLAQKKRVRIVDRDIVARVEKADDDDAT